METYFSLDGYAFIIGSAIITWSSKKQLLVSILSIDIKYVTLAIARIETLSLCIVLKNYKTLKLEKFLIYENNQNTIIITKNPIYHGHTKYWDIKNHFIK